MGSRERGQGALELALILPVLLILVILMVEAGFAMRNYLLVMAANREGVRFAARGRFSDETIAERILAAGGVVQTPGGAIPFLRTGEPNPNTGIIITHIPIQDDGSVSGSIVYITGTISLTDTRPIQASDSRVDLVSITDRNVSATVLINSQRESAGYERLDNEIIILEVFYAHNTLWRYDFAPIRTPWSMYTQSSMRVVTDSRQD